MGSSNHSPTEILLYSESRRLLPNLDRDPGRPGERPGVRRLRPNGIHLFGTRSRLETEVVQQDGPSHGLRHRAGPGQHDASADRETRNERQPRDAYRRSHQHRRNGHEYVSVDKNRFVRICSDQQCHRRHNCPTDERGMAVCGRPRVSDGTTSATVALTGRRFRTDGSWTMDATANAAPKKSTASRRSCAPVGPKPTSLCLPGPPLSARFRVERVVWLVAMLR